MNGLRYEKSGGRPGDHMLVVFLCQKRVKRPRQFGRRPLADRHAVPPFQITAQRSVQFDHGFGSGRRFLDDDGQDDRQQRHDDRRSATAERDLLPRRGLFGSFLLFFFRNYFFFCFFCWLI